MLTWLRRKSQYIQHHAVPAALKAANNATRRVSFLQCVLTLRCRPNHSTHSITNATSSGSQNSALLCWPRTHRVPRSSQCVARWLYTCAINHGVLMQTLHLNTLAPWQQALQTAATMHSPLVTPVRAVVAAPLITAHTTSCGERLPTNSTTTHRLSRQCVQCWQRR
jgi:hypothetical protein